MSEEETRSDEVRTAQGQKADSARSPSKLTYFQQWILVLIAVGIIAFLYQGYADRRARFMEGRARFMEDCMKNFGAARLSPDSLRFSAQRCEAAWRASQP